MDNNLPELTLTPNMNSVSDVLPLPGGAETAEALEPRRESPALRLDESRLTEAERKALADFAEKIDITDSN